MVYLLYVLTISYDSSENLC